MHTGIAVIATDPTTLVNLLAWTYEAILQLQCYPTGHTKLSRMQTLSGSDYKQFPLLLQAAVSVLTTSNMWSPILT